MLAEVQRRPVVRYVSSYFILLHDTTQLMSFRLHACQRTLVRASSALRRVPHDIPRRRPGSLNKNSFRVLNLAALSAHWSQTKKLVPSGLTIEPLDARSRWWPGRDRMKPTSGCQGAEDVAGTFQILQKQLCVSRNSHDGASLEMRGKHTPMP